MNKNIIETIMGVVVIIITFVFIYIAYNASNMNTVRSGSYTINASFNRIDGIEIGSDVKVNGIKIGRVSSQSLNPKNYSAYIEMQINSTLSLPTDTSAEIVSSGLLSDKYVALTPGSETEKLKEGSTIEFTQSPINLENLIGKIAFGSTSPGPSSHNLTHTPNEDSKSDSEDNKHQDEPTPELSPQMNTKPSSSLKIPQDTIGSLIGELYSLLAIFLANV